MKYYYEIDENNVSVVGPVNLEDSVTPPSNYIEITMKYEQYPTLGTTWLGDSWDVPVLTPAELRERRTAELNTSDWTQLSDSPLTAEAKEEWKVYRQGLRDSLEGYDGSTFLPRMVRPDCAQ
jgi:hypothetical protein